MMRVAKRSHFKAKPSLQGQLFVTACIVYSMYTKGIDLIHYQNYLLKSDVTRQFSDANKSKQRVIHFFSELLK